MFSRLVVLLILSILFSSFSLAQGPAPSPSEKEIALGRTLMAALESEAGPLEDPAVIEFVQSITQKLGDASGTQTFLTVRVLDGPEAAAHALPGGFLLVRSGLIAGVATTAEFAAVLAHEIAHIAAGHGKRQAAEPPTHRAVDSVPLIYLGGRTGICTRVSGSMAVPAGFLEQAERQEEQADLLALEYLHRTGYDPNGLVEALDRITRGSTAENARTTSAVGDRAAQYARTGRSYVTNSSAFQAIRQKLPKTRPQQQAASTPSLRRAEEQ